MANTYYVSTQGNNQNPGTIDRPFKTIGKAASLAQAGDTVSIRGGVYREEVIRPANSGTAAAPITFTAYGGEKVVISGTRLLTPGEKGVGQWERHTLANGKAIYKIQLPETYDRGEGGNQIFVNGQAMTEARWPNIPDSAKLDRDDYAISTQGSLGDLSSNGLYNATYEHSGIKSFWKGGQISFNSGMEWGGTSSKILDASAGKVKFETEIRSSHSSGNSDPSTPATDDPFLLWGKLEALDTEKEWFLDSKGEYGPARTLYLWSPGGNPNNQTIEIKNNFLLFDFNQSYIHLKNLNFVAGKIRSSSNSKGLVLDGVTSKYGVHNLKGAGGAAIELDGSNHRLLNSRISETSNKGVQIYGDNHLIKNNVIDDVGYAMAAWAGDGIDVKGTGTEILHNTVFNVGKRGIFISGLEGGKISYNEVYNTGKLRTDVAGITSFIGGDGKGTEISYNWVHDINAYYNPENRHLGGQGIRLDPGGQPEGTSNYKIHHNLIWDVTGGNSIEVWSLSPGMQNYGDTGIDIYNNTVDKGIRLFGLSGASHEGTTVNNNITLGAIKYGGSSSRNGSIENNLDSLSNPQLVNPQTNDFRLTASSPAIDAAKSLAGVNYNVPDGKPDIGALEYGQAPFVAGATIENKHLDALSLTINPAEQTDLVEVKVNHLPAHRVLPADFMLKIGDKTIGQEALVNLSFDQTTATLYYRKSAFSGLSNNQLVQVQIGSGSAVEVEVEQFDLGRSAAPEIVIVPEVIGETGSLSTLNHNSQTIVLKNSYINPVVFAQPLSYNGFDPASVRITDIQSDRFSVYLQEPDSLDGLHAKRESFSYLVVEAGTWQLADGSVLEANTFDAKTTTTTGWETINFSTQFENAPVVLSQVQTQNDSQFVRTRQKNTSSESFQLALEEEEALQSSGHSPEAIGWLAISPGQGSGEGFTYQAGSTGDGVTHDWHTLNFSQAFTQAPQLLASIATFDDADSVGLRYQQLTPTGVQLKLEEDTSLDSETVHTTEAINFLAIEGSELKAVAYGTGAQSAALGGLGANPDPDMVAALAADSSSSGL